MKASAWIGDEQVGAQRARLGGASLQGDEVVVVARQDRPQPGLGIDQGLQPARHGEGHLLLDEAAGAARAGVLAAMTGIDGDGDQAVETRVAAGADGDLLARGVGPCGLDAGRLDGSAMPPPTAPARWPGATG
jgi:hypothetical protein